MNYYINIHYIHNTTKKKVCILSSPFPWSQGQRRLFCCFVLCEYLGAPAWQSPLFSNTQWRGQWGPLNKKLFGALKGVVLRVCLTIKRELPGGLLPWRAPLRLRAVAGLSSPAQQSHSDSQSTQTHKDPNGYQACKHKRPRHQSSRRWLELTPSLDPSPKWDIQPQCCLRLLIIVQP